MARRRAQPVRLTWAETPAPAQASVQLVRQTIVPPAPGGRQLGRLIHGDNLAVMSALLPELEGRIDLVYIDPPFRSGKAYPARVARQRIRSANDWLTRPLR
jgi:16S rRNA G966 N2-methylase RsmD